jgi:hypothetical protein
MSLLKTDNKLQCLACGYMRLVDYGFFCKKYKLTITKDKDKFHVRLAKCTEGIRSMSRIRKDALECLTDRRGC